jgi:hypothetical protein
VSGVEGFSACFCEFSSQRNRESNLTRQRALARGLSDSSTRFRAFSFKLFKSSFNFLSALLSTFSHSHERGCDIESWRKHHYSRGGGNVEILVQMNRVTDAYVIQGITT